MDCSYVPASRCRSTPRRPWNSSWRHGPLACGARPENKGFLDPKPLYGLMVAVRGLVLQGGDIDFGGDAPRDLMASRRSLAIVDDDSLVRAALASLARSQGLSVTTFASAEDFLHKTQLDDFDCVLSDIQMPGLSGLELLQVLARRCPQTPVVIMTALAEPRLRDQALTGGARAFLDKPFEPAEVIALLEEIFGPF